MTTATEVPAAVRERMVLGLDLDDLGAAEAIARRVAPWFGVVKVGYQLYGSAGPAAFDRLHGLGFGVFCDLKLHDIPNTVEHGARALARHRVEFLNAHAAGGETMLRAFVAGAHAGAADAGTPPPVTLAVTVLTSEPDAGAFPERLAVARAAGCDGVVCSAHEVTPATSAGMRTMVPGIRLRGGDANDQARVATPGEAVTTGASWIVLARTITTAPDPEAAAASAAAEVATALDAR
jgi:orotidine-5'-phosphate decarboxylase